MKSIYVLLFFLAAMRLSAQTFGATPLDVKGNFDVDKPVYNTWLRHGTSANVTMKFEQSAAGIENAMQAIERLLVENDRSMNDVDIYKSVEAPELKNSKSTDILNTSVLKGRSKINLSWYLKDQSVLQLFIGQNSYEINVMNAYK